MCTNINDIYFLRAFLKTSLSRSKWNVISFLLRNEYFCLYLLATFLAIWFKRPISFRINIWCFTILKVLRRKERLQVIYCRTFRYILPNTGVVDRTLLLCFCTKTVIAHGYKKQCSLKREQVREITRVAS